MEHIEGDTVFNMTVSSDTVHAFLHFAVTSVTAFDGVRTRDCQQSTVFLSGHPFSTNILSQTGQDSSAACCCAGGTAFLQDAGTR